MAWKDYRKKVAVGLWALVCLLFAPSVYHLATYSLPESETLVCYPEFNPAYSEEGYEQLEREFAEQLRSNLNESDDPDAKLMAVLVSSTGRVNSANIDELVLLNQQFPESGLIAYQLLTACADDPTNVLCGSQIDSILDFHSDNAGIWAAHALFKLSLEDEFAAKVSLRRAASAPTYDDYWTDQIRVLRDYSPADSGLELLSTVFYFFNYTDTTIGIRTMDFVTSPCSEWPATDPLLMDACIEYGQKIIDESQTIIGARLGYSVQEVAYRAVGNFTESNARELEGRRFRYAIPSVDGLVSLMTYDEELAEFWLQSLIDFGEIDAQSVIEEEVNRRRSNPEYQPCDPPGLRFEFPYFYFGEERVQW